MSGDDQHRHEAAERARESRGDGPPPDVDRLDRIIELLEQIEENTRK